MSITSEVINEKIEDLKHDLQELLKKEEMIMKLATKYKPNCVEVRSLVVKATADAHTRVVDTIWREIRVYKNCFSDGMIKDLDYIIDMHDGLTIGDIRMIVTTRADIVKFEESGISEKDYARDMKSIENKIDDISKFNAGIRFYTMDIPNHKNEAIKSLVFALTRELRGYIENIPDKPINSDAIKDIITVISDVERMRKGQNSFNKMMIETIDDIIKRRQ